MRSPAAVGIPVACLFAGAIAVAALVATTHAQTSTERSGSGPCQRVSKQSLPDLYARKQALADEIARAEAAASEATPGRSGKDAVRNKRQADLRKKQEALLQVIFQIDCQNSEPAREEARAAGAGAGAEVQQGQDKSLKAERAPEAQPRVASAPEVIEVTTYYATNRDLTSSKVAAQRYGQQFQNTLQYGRAIVTIPSVHKIGNLELPSLWRLERTPDQSKHFVLKDVIPLKNDAAKEEMAQRLRNMQSKSLLLFVHGYNMDFAQAALRTAQLAHDLEFPGMPMFYSWPSAGRILGYWQDEETSQLSEGVFERLLGDLSLLPVTDIYVLAHSMGNRIVANGLRNRVEKGENIKHVSEILLAAPDINAELFRTVIAPKLATMQGTRTTLYASSYDLALEASRVVHGFRRVGDTLGGVFTYPGFETVDASQVSLTTRAYGHSYLMDSAAVLKDIRTIIGQRFAAKQRGLLEMGASPDFYWQLK